MSPNRKRYETLEEMIREYQIDGVVEVVLNCCHTYAAESYSVRELVQKQMGVPVLSITTDYSRSDAGQLSTRIGAFLEMLMD